MKVEAVGAAAATTIFSLTIIGVLSASNILIYTVNVPAVAKLKYAPFASPLCWKMPNEVLAALLVLRISFVKFVPVPLTPSLITK